MKVKFEEKEEMLPDLIGFYWMMKSMLEETISGMNTLKDEHKSMLKKCRFLSVSVDNLSTLVNPSIIKLKEEDDRKGMHKLGPFLKTNQHLFLSLSISLDNKKKVFYYITM